MKRIILIVIVNLITASSTLIGQSRLDYVKELMSKQRIIEAISVCQTYLQSSSRDENAWFLLAKAYQQIGNLDSAEIAAAKAVELEDELLDGYTLLAEIRLTKKNLNEAYQTASSGLKISKKLNKQEYSPLLFVLGDILYEADSLDAALVAFSKVVEYEQNNAHAYERRGDVYLKQGVAPMAISQYERSLEIDSSQQKLLYKLANVYSKERQYTDAARTYNRLLSQKPDDESARLELAILYYKAKQWAKCVTTLKDYFKHQKNPPKDIQSMYMEVLYNCKQYKDALPVAMEFQKLEPNSKLAARIIARGLIVDKQYAQAIEAYKKLATLDTMEFDDYQRLGFAYEQIKKDTLAAVTYEQALLIDTTQTDSVKAISYGRIGTIWMRLKNWQRAAENFERRIQLDTTAVGASFNYASCMIQLEQYEKASSALKKAINKNPKYPPAYVNLGFCYFQMKDYDAGQKEFETAIKVIDTMQTKYSIELADSYRMIALAIMMEKKTTEESSRKKWEDAIVILKKSIKYKEDVAQTHLLLGQCYQNLNKIDDAIKEYKRVLKLDPKNKDAQKYLDDLLKLK